LGAAELRYDFWFLVMLGGCCLLENEALDEKSTDELVEGFRVKRCGCLATCVDGIKEGFHLSGCNFYFADFPYDFPSQHWRSYGGDK
jgi:hypothetical protein